MILGDLLLRNAERAPDQIAFIAEGQRVTHAQYAARSAQAANMLHALGARKQDRILILAQNGSAICELYGAAERAGFIAAPMNYRLAPAEMAVVLNDCEPAVLAFEAQYTAGVDSLRSKLQGSVLFLCIGGECPSWAQDYASAMNAASSTTPALRASEDDVAYLVYTSGTTGKPKGVMLAHRGQIEVARHIAVDIEVVPDDRLLLIMPLCHVGAMCERIGHSWQGATLVIHRSFDPLQVLDTIPREGITILHMASTMLQAVLDAPGFDKMDRSRLKTIQYSASPMPPVLLKRALTTFGPILVQLYGMTETGPQGTLLGKKEHVLDGTPAAQARLSSAGKPTAGVSVRIVSEEGKDCLPGASGEIWIKSPSLMKGYWKQPELTKSACGDGWMRTGDVGYLDDDGFLFIIDRKKDMIVSGGQNIYTREVENALRAHPAVLDAAVFGIPDDHWGEAVKAVVVLRKSGQTSADELIEHCRRSIASYKKPKSLDFVDALPYLASGKVNKESLRAPYWAKHSRRI
jgi:acyl-CoA synthetase (AMP-forming)/AMP-acid ligase II